MKKLFYIALFLLFASIAQAVTTVPLGKNGTEQYLLYPTDNLKAAYFVATSTASSTFAGPIVLNGHVTTDGLRARTSSGVDLHSNNGVIIANFGAGGGNNATFYGGVNINGALTGPSGTFGSATVGTLVATTSASTTNLIVSRNATSATAFFGSETSFVATTGVVTINGNTGRALILNGSTGQNNAALTLTNSNSTTCGAGTASYVSLGVNNNTFEIRGPGCSNGRIDLVSQSGTSILRGWPSGGVSVGYNGTDPGAGILGVLNRVGIGTTTPYAALSVVGEAVATNFTATGTATSTFAGPLSVSAFRIPGITTGCAEWNSNGMLGSTGVACGSGSGGSPYPFSVTGNATTSLVGFYGGILGNYSLFGSSTAGVFYATSTATSTFVGPIQGPIIDKGGQVFNVLAYGAKGDGVTNDNTAVTSAVAALNAYVARNGTTTGILLFPHGYNFVLSPSIEISSNTHIINQGRITVDPNYVVGALSFVGIFRLGDTSGTDIVDNVIIEGGSVYGQAFTTYEDENPTFNPNDHRYVLYVHSVATHRNVIFRNVSVFNIGSPITLEKVGGINGTPSSGISIHDVYQERIWVGPQLYCNGWLYENVSIKNISGRFVYDDFVAIVTDDGGTGGTGIGRNIQVSNIYGEKTGQAAAFVKLDSTDGRLQYVNVDNINGYTEGADEYLVGIIGATQVQTKGITLSNIKAIGSWYYGLYAQTNGNGIELDNFYIEALYGAHFQANQAPNRYMNIKVTNGTFANRSSYTGDTADGYGLSYSAGTVSQGLQNVKVQNVAFLNKSIPIYEGPNPTAGSLLKGTYLNFDYDVDFGDKSVASSTFTASSSRLKFSNLGNYQKESPIFISDFFGSNSPLLAISSTTNASSTATTSIFTVLHNGNVGVGSSSPQSAFAVGAGQITVLNGSNSAPSYSFATEKNSGMYLVSSGNIGISVNGTQNVQLDSQNLYAPNANGYLFNNTSANSVTSPNIRPNRASSNTGFGAGSTGNINAIVGGVEVMRWTSTGVGIGTSSPYAKLSVAGQVVGEVFNATSTSGTSTLPNLQASSSLITNLQILGGFAQTSFGDCNGSSNKVVYTLATGRFGCDTDQSGGGSLNTGSLTIGILSATTSFTANTASIGTSSIGTLNATSSLNIMGTTTGNGASFTYLTLNGGNVTAGNASFSNATSSGIFASLSGTSTFANLTVSGNASTSALFVSGTTTGRGFTGAFASLSNLNLLGGYFQDSFTDCTGASNKVVYTLSTGKFGCATDQTGGGSGASASGGYGEIQLSNGAAGFISTSGFLLSTSSFGTFLAVGTSTNQWGQVSSSTLYVAGVIESSHKFVGCDVVIPNIGALTTNAAITVDSSLTNCPGFVFDESVDGEVRVITAGELVNMATTSPYVVMGGGNAGVATGDGIAMRMGSNIATATNSPMMEAEVRIHATQNATSSLHNIYFVGFTSHAPTITTGAANLHLHPTNGAYFYAGSSSNNWIARTVANNVFTETVTTVASSSPTSTPAFPFRTFKVDLSSTSATFLINGRVVAVHTTNLPVRPMTPIVTHAVANAGGLASPIHVAKLKAWIRHLTQ